MKTDEVRNKYLRFFEKRGHSIIKSASLIPKNDTTTLFTSSGMQPLLSYFLGKKHISGTRLANSQKCFRAEDIEEIGDNRHTTFFEMLGNWSFGDYFKKEQIEQFFKFLTTEIKLEPKKLYITVFVGDKKNKIPRDIESVKIWKNIFESNKIKAEDIEILDEENGGKIGMRGGRIFYYNAKYNWWSRAGAPDKMPSDEPGGADSEVFYDFGEDIHNKKFGEHCHPNCKCGRFMEIGNSVFIEYIKQKDGSFSRLPMKNVDFGGGLERITAASNSDNDIFNIDTISFVIKKIEEISGRMYADNKKEFRIIADHIRASVFIIASGIMSSNTGQGYILRRLIRRVIRFSDKLDILHGHLSDISKTVINQYNKIYSELNENKEKITEEINKEERRFRKTLEKGLIEFEKISKRRNISGNDAFILFTTYGFPIEMTIELAEEKGLSVDKNEFNKKMKEHRELSRIGAEQKFKGGLIDTGEMSVKYHTATHLLLRALKDVLGESVRQKGSNITSERLRLDFSWGEKMTDEQKQNTEDLVNEKIKSAIDVKKEEIPAKEVARQNIGGEFEDKYGDIITVYKIGNYSIELCGGPHIKNTAELGHFKIKKEESVSSGIRRIKAVLE